MESLKIGITEAVNKLVSSIKCDYDIQYSNDGSSVVININSLSCMWDVLRNAADLDPYAIILVCYVLLPFNSPIGVSIRNVFLALKDENYVKIHVFFMDGGTVVPMVVVLRK